MTTTTSRRASAIVLLSAALSACGGSSTSDPNATGGASGSGGSSASGGSAGFGGAAGSGGSGGGSAGSAGSAGSNCDAYRDETPPPQTWTIRIQNARPQPIYLGGDAGGCGPVLPYQLFGPAGSVQMFAGGCGHTCEALQQHDNWCTDACMIPPIIYIEPGGYYDASWSGTTYRAETMPTSCYFDPTYAPPTCDRRVIADPGAYVATSSAWTALNCYDVNSCACMPNAAGSCEIPYGGQPSGEMLEAKAEWQFPSESLATLTFH